MSMGDLPQLESQYDANRLTAVSIKWLPGLPNGAITTSYAPMALVYDRDGIEGNIKGLSLAELMEQVNGVRVKNMYRPWKKYIKFPKYKINTRIPSHNELPSSITTTYEPNENLAGQWKRVGQPLTHSFFGSDYVYVERGTHILLHVERPPGLTGDGLLGSFVITSYYVYKDRR